MRHKLVPESLAERFALWTGKVPLPVVDTLFPLVKARALMAAERLGIFEALREEALPTAALAGVLRLDEESLRLLLRVLEASGYLGVRGGRYRLSPLARRTLIRGGSAECVGFVRFNYAQWGFLEHLEDLVQTGRGLDVHRSMRAVRDWENYQRAMQEIARLHAPILARHVPVRAGARILLDLAGGHGLLGAALCRRHPPLRSRVLELAAALEPARRLASEEGIADVVEHVPADLRRDDLGSGADVILLANVLHHLSPEESLDLLHRARRAMTPGGTIAIWEIERRPDGDRAELGRDAIALFFRLTSASRCFSAADFREWLAAAGFTPARCFRSALAPLHLLVHASKA
jgi:2-polyprenyl-3-methyl-5-hydroxy-6-metoxy-1,4-benzoquinol methylase